MQAAVENNSLVDDDPVEDFWRICANKTANSAMELQKAGYHKQIVNRLLEPFMWTKGVITATLAGWESFFALRIHPDAQPEIMELAKEIKDAIDKSSYEDLSEGEWHLPYVNSIKDYDSLEDAIKVSTSCCAQVSYRMLDDSLDKAKKIYELLNLPEKGLYKEDPAHFSPCEHVAMATSEYYNTEELGLLFNETGCSGNFQTCDYFQYRKALEVGVEHGLFL